MAVTITSTLMRTSSATMSGIRSRRPSPYRRSRMMFCPSTYPCSRSPCLNASLKDATTVVVLPKTTPMRGTFAACCALYSSALAVAPSGVNAMTTPVVKRRRDITVRPPVRRRELSPAEGTGAGETNERRPKPDGQELADQRTLLRRALGGSCRDCPGRQENGARGSRESGPPEGRYKANLAVPAPRPRGHGPEGGGRVRYYLGVDWADQTHAVWVVDESGAKITARAVAHTAEGLGEWGRELDEWRAQGLDLWAAIERPDGRVVDFLLDHGVVVYPVNPKALDRARDRFG